MKSLSVDKGDHVAVVDSGSKPHPIVSHQRRTRARYETHTAVLDTLSKDPHRDGNQVD
jgi:hypothetical protein